MPFAWDPISRADLEDNRAELTRIFESITTDQLNGITDFDDASNLFQQILNNFDKNNVHPEFLLKLFNSRNVDWARVNINFQNDRNGFTALMYAADNGHLLVVEHLMSYGVDPRYETSYGQTAFFCACIMGHVRVARYLLPYVDKRREFTLTRPYNGFTIKDEVMAKLKASPNAQNYLELKQLIDNEMEALGL
ncbi:hypothetical protein MMC31_001062 [Peltigera leucophlebia]|nr:hypothetical protein [Peltigera leucophlebia]